VAQIEVAVAENVTALVLRVITCRTKPTWRRSGIRGTPRDRALPPPGGLDSVVPLSPRGAANYNLRVAGGIEFAPTVSSRSGELNRLMVCASNCSATPE
jgi:hypothetical protein